MSVAEVITTTVVISTVSVLFLAHATAGNYLIGGHKVSKFKDVLHPFEGKFQSGPTKNKTNLLLVLWYLLFPVLLIAFLKNIMSLKNSLRVWIEQLIGSPQVEDGAVGISQSASNVTSNTTKSNTTKSNTTKSNTSLAKRKSSSKIHKSRSRSRTPPEKKPKKPSNLMQSPVVDSHSPMMQLMPPRLSFQEDTSEKLNRLLGKFDEMDTNTDKKKEE